MATVFERSSGFLKKAKGITKILGEIGQVKFTIYPCCVAAGWAGPTARCRRIST